MPPPTPQEISVYCRDPSQDITKPTDEVIELQIPSLKQELENNGPGYYTFFCRKNKDGSNTCDAEPYNSEPKTYLKCDQNMPPPQFVINPLNPLQLNAGGELLGNESEIRDCGRGWRGKLTARYLARRCQLMKVDTNGTTTVLSTAQTIYRIGYAQAQCETDIQTTAACPSSSQLPGSDSSKRIPVTQHVTMLKPVALDWSETKPSPAAWDTSKIAAPPPGGSRQEVLDSANLEAPGKPKAVVPLITRAALDSLTGNAWSEALADAMYAADNSSIKRTVTSCNNAGNPCGIPTPQKGIEIWVEGERRLWPYLGDAFNMRNLTCSVAPHERCNPILGETQSMCSGECGPSQVNPDLYVSGGNFEELINSYFSYVETPIPPGNAILRVAPATTVPLFNDPNALCDLASTEISNLMIFGTYKEDQASFGEVRECPGLPGKTYTDSRDMFDDAINAYLARGGNLMIFTDHVKMGNENVPFFIEDISANIFRPDGKVTTTLQNWLIDAPPPGDPCSVIPKG